MPLSINIKKIERRGPRCTLIYVGAKTVYEVPGGLADFKRWVRDQVESITPQQLAALRIAAAYRESPDLTDFSVVEGSSASLTIGGKDIG